MTIITEAGYTITTPGSYSLGADISYSESSGYAISILCDGVTLDLNGYTLSNVSAGLNTIATGIYAQDQSNITITNGIIEGFMYPVLLRDTTDGAATYGGHLISGVTISDGTFRGIRVEGAGNTVEFCEIAGIGGSTFFSDAFAFGIESFGPNATIERNLISQIYATTGLGEGVGISVSEWGVGTVVRDNLIRNTQLLETGTYGIWVGGESDVQVINNTTVNFQYGQGWSAVAAGVLAQNTTIDSPGYYVINFPGNKIDGGGNVSFFSESSDSIVGDSWNNHFIGREGNDILYGMAGDDLLYGTDGNDSLLGGVGNDNLVGGEGDDHLWGGADADLLQGGNGFDWAIYDESTTGIKVSFVNPLLNTGIAQSDRFVSIEGLVLTVYDDYGYGSVEDNEILGLAGNDKIFGYGGNDILVGADGNDQLFGGFGADTLDGGQGFDYVRYDDVSSAGFVVSLSNWQLNTVLALGDVFIDVEGLILSSGNDVAYGDKNNNYIYGRAGNDALYGYEGKDFLFGEAGADRFMFDTAPSQSNVDTIGDFDPGIDKIGLASFFYGATDMGGGGIRLEQGDSIQPSTSDSAVLYSTDTFLLSFYAGEGNSQGVLPIAVLPGVSSLSPTDFLFI